MTADERPHVMKYSAGALGFGDIGIPDRAPRWHCICGAWSFAAKSMPTRRDGNNKIEATRSYLTHVSALLPPT